VKKNAFSREVQPNWQGLYDCVLRKGTPDRVYNAELLLDTEVQEAVCERFGLLKGIEKTDPHYDLHMHMAVQRFLGYDYVRVGLLGADLQLSFISTKDTADLARKGGRRDFIDEHKGPIGSWDDFNAYPWPDVEKASTEALEWYSENLPEGMCIIGGGGFAHSAEHLTMLFGYEKLCFALFDQRDLVKAVADRLLDMYRTMLKKILEFERVKFVWGSDDMGFRSGTLISPDDLREFALPGHKLMAQMSHNAGRPYLLHSCGNLGDIMEDLIEDVEIDAKHSFEDTIEDVRDAKKKYGNRIALFGGIDVDFLCRSDEQQIRERVRDTLDKCMPGGGYCLGTGNSVANYIPLDNYLAMLDEGRNYAS